VVLPGRTDPEILEALACREGIALACDINAREAHIASDCQMVIRSLEGGSMGVYGHIVREIVESKVGFQKLTFGHERRSSNKEAHNLARSVIRDDGVAECGLSTCLRAYVSPLLLTLNK
jgi:ribonuclease HI